MTAVPTERPLALAVVAVLEAALGAGLVGYGKKPAAGGWQAAGTPTTDTPFTGYAVVYAGQTSPGEGTVAAPAADGVQGWQVSSFGATAGQADAIRDRCRLALAGLRLTVTGRYCGLTELADGQATRPDKDVTPPVFFAADRFTAYTSPA